MAIIANIATAFVVTVVVVVVADVAVLAVVVVVGRATMTRPSDHIPHFCSSGMEQITSISPAHHIQIIPEIKTKFYDYH